MEINLSGKVALVTGASRGIGEATAQELARAGASVAVTARSKDALDSLVQSIEKAGGQALAVPADIGRPTDIDNVVKETVDKFGGIDILVNNAGVMSQARQIYNYGLEEWDEAMNVNLRSAWYLSKLVHPSMRERGGGAIVNVSTTSGLHHDIGLGLYGVSKAALIFLSTVCAKEWARDNIRVNCIAPGVVRTELAQPILSWLESHSEKPNPMNIIGEPGEIANLILFLVSDQARYITGDVIRIDGGELL